MIIFLKHFYRYLGQKKFNFLSKSRVVLLAGVINPPPPPSGIGLKVKRGPKEKINKIFSIMAHPTFHLKSNMALVILTRSNSFPCFGNIGPGKLRKYNSDQRMLESLLPHK